jgi:hypothetical protein
MKRANPLEDGSSSDEESLSQKKRPKKEVTIPLPKQDAQTSSTHIIPLKPGIKLNPTTEKKLFKTDMSNRPDVSSLADYDDVPVEDFGEAMLRGMGWSKGKSLGKNKRYARY